MRNTWKGMILGALSGAVVGLALDSIDRAIRGANSAAHAAPDAASRGTGWARQRAAEFVHESAERAQRATRKAMANASERDGNTVHH